MEVDGGGAEERCGAGFGRGGRGLNKGCGGDSFALLFSGSDYCQF